MISSTSCQCWPLERPWDDKNKRYKTDVSVDEIRRTVSFFGSTSGEPGWRFIDLYPGIYKGTETRPNNFRIPQLTYYDDHPGEDYPAFRFAFEVTEPR